MKKEKILYTLLCILPICKIIDVYISLAYSIGKISFEFDGTYYIIIGFIDQSLFKKDKIAFASIIVMLLMTTFTILLKYNIIL